MTVTGLIPLEKKRYRIELDGAYAFTLYKGELRTYGIRDGGEVSQATYDEVMTVVLPRRAKLRAMNLLMSRFYTIKQLSDKLKDGGYPEDIIHGTIEYLKDYHYLDDVRYAEDFLRSKASSYSRKELMQKLTQKGISREHQEWAFQHLEESESLFDETGTIRRLLEKKKFSQAAMDYQKQQKLLAFFYRKGFSLDKVKEVMDSF